GGCLGCVTDCGCARPVHRDAADGWRTLRCLTGCFHRGCYRLGSCPAGIFQLEPLAQSEAVRNPAFCPGLDCCPGCYFGYCYLGCGCQRALHWCCCCCRCDGGDVDDCWTCYRRYSTS